MTRPVWRGWRSGRWRRPALTLIAAAALVALATLVPVDELRASVTAAGRAGPVLAVLGGALLLAALVPRTAISVACGALFGVPSGAGLALAAALVGAVATFTAGRLAATRLRGRHRPPGTGVSSGQLRGRPERWAKLDAWLTRRGLLGVIVVRLLPLAPFGLVGYLYGTTGVRVRHYLVGTALAATPSAVSYAVIGAAAVAPSSVDTLALAVAALGLVVSASAALYWRRSRVRPGPGSTGSGAAHPH